MSEADEFAQLHREAVRVANENGVPSQGVDGNVIASLKEALTRWRTEPVDDRLALARNEHSQFLDRFPIGSWQILPLEKYALGPPTYKASYGWWLEWGTKNIGSISGGSASKHLIFFKRDGVWQFPHEYQSVEEAWESVRSGFVEMLHLASEGDFDGAYDVPQLAGAIVVRLKTLYLYFPDALLPIFARPHLNHFLGLLGEAESDDAVVALNRRLLALLRTIPELDALDTQELGLLLYRWSHPNQTVSIYKIAPGEQGSQFSDCLEGNYICVHWDEVGDLSEFTSKEDFKEAFRADYGYEGNESQVTKKSNELWTLTELKPGDRIIANRGTSEILAIGTVNESGYVWRDDRSEFKHTVGVDWDTTLARKISPKKAWAMVTVAKVSASVFRELTDGAIQQQPDAAELRLYLDLEEAMARRGQVILYGPPGTGKTYSARRAAVWLLRGGSSSPEALAVLSDDKAFEEAEAHFTSSSIPATQVWWVVSNPKQWSWDDLRKQGAVHYSLGKLTKNFELVRAGDLVVGYAATPVKRVVALARVVSDYDPDAPPEDALILEPVTEVRDGLTYEDLINDPILETSEPARNKCRGTLFALSPVEADRLLGRLSETDPKIAKAIEPAGVQRLTQITFHPSYSYEDFIEGFRPQASGEGVLDLRLVDGLFKRVCITAADDPDNSYVVMIDEINRGNIAKIFGELITLIEKDKRDNLSVVLSQSGERFHVPSNLMIIGTMNTADRSIQLLDTALRRRFAFIEVLPEAEVLAGATVGDLILEQFLRGLNDSLRDHHDRERQIGHAFFFSGGKVVNSPESLASTFRHELLPQLQEYLFDDYQALADLLGEEIIDPDAQRPTSIIYEPEALCSSLAKRFNASASS